MSATMGRHLLPRLRGAHLAPESEAEQRAVGEGIAEWVDEAGFALGETYAETRTFVVRQRALPEGQDHSPGHMNMQVVVVCT
jgi:hypothetical protein